MKKNKYRRVDESCATQIRMGKLSTLLAELEEQAVLNRLGEDLANGIEPLTIIEHCHKGMIQVGERYEEGEYFISGTDHGR